MAIAKDASTPAAVDNLGSVSGTAVTASFSPPANSLVRIVVNIGFSASTPTSPTVTVADSGSTSYTAGPVKYDNTFDFTAQFQHFYAAAPGSITVTATRTVSLGSALFEVIAYVLTGAAATQTGAATATSTSNGTTSEGSITTTQTGSWSIVGTTIADNEALTAVTLATDHSVSDATDVISGAAGHAVTGTPGATNMGWSFSSAANSSWAAWEVLPAATSGPALLMASFP